MNILETIWNNRTEILLAITGLVTAASITLKYVAPLTKNKVDDRIYKILVSVLELLSIANKKNKILKIKINPNKK